MQTAFTSRPTQDDIDFHHFSARSTLIQTYLTNHIMLRATFIFTSMALSIFGRQAVGQTMNQSDSNLATDPGGMFWILQHAGLAKFLSLVNVRQIALSEAAK